MFSKMSRFHFRKDLKYDLALLSETNSLNPFSVSSNKATKIWDEISTHLKESQLNLPVTGRRCRERVTQLLKEFRCQEQLSVKSSGIEEADMSEVKFLLTSIASHEDARPVFVSEQIENKKARIAAETTRDEALLDVQSTPEFIDLLDLNGEGIGTDSSGGTTQNQMDIEENVPKKRKKTASLDAEDLVVYLRNKNKNEVEVKLEELKVRAAEAENQKFELELQKQKQEFELQDRKRMNDFILKLAEQNTKQNTN